MKVENLDNHNISRGGVTKIQFLDEPKTVNGRNVNAFDILYIPKDGYIDPHDHDAIPEGYCAINLTKIADTLGMSNRFGNDSSRGILEKRKIEDPSLADWD